VTASGSNSPLGGFGPGGHLPVIVPARVVIERIDLPPTMSPPLPQESSSVVLCRSCPLQRCSLDPLQPPLPYHHRRLPAPLHRSKQHLELQIYTSFDTTTSSFASTTSPHLWFGVSSTFGDGFLPNFRSTVGLSSTPSSLLQSTLCAASILVYMPLAASL
jgi:hypothetical protein